MSFIKKSRIVVVGAGVVGLAVAQKLSLKHDVFLLEAGPRIAEGVTSRNSGVVHASIYYPPNSFKAKFCLEGRALLYEWCKKYSVPHSKIGKIILATQTEHLDDLELTLKNAHEIGATETHLITKKEIKRLEPNVEGISAVFSPETGIVDPYELSYSFLQVAEKNGATLFNSCAVVGAERARDQIIVLTTRGPIECDHVINCAGLHADDVAAYNPDASHAYKIYPWRGDYFNFQPGVKFFRLIYPVKTKASAGLGVHLTIDLNGKYRLGPDVELVDSKTNFLPKPEKIDSFLTATQKLFAWATREMLTYDTCGIRPKLRNPHDKTDPDFMILWSSPQWMDLLGIESPGLTSALAIANYVEQKI